MHNRILKDTAIHDEWLQLAIRDTASTEYDVQESVEHIGFFLASSVVILEWSSVDDLRQRVHWANDLDREAVEKLFVPTVTHAEDQCEAIARRITHHSSRGALEQIKSRRLRQNLRARSASGLRDGGVLPAYSPMPGMGRRELKDFPGHDDFAVQQGQGTLNERIDS